MATPKHIPVGATFGQLFVESLDRIEPKNGAFVLARCSCGAARVYRLNYLESGHTSSCGCLRGTRNKERTTHGHTHRGEVTATWRAYRDMRTRCENPKYHEFHLYGGRGIKVCDRWREGYAKFLADMGERPAGMTLERQRVNEDYSAENCVWASRVAQANNKRNSCCVELNGRRQTVAEWSRELGILDKTIYFRLAKGWPPERALAPPR